MKVSWSIPFLALASLILITGCNTVDKAVDQKVSQEKPATHPGELASRGFEAWATSANMDGDQKSKIWSIQANTMREAMRIREEITKTKSAMFKELAKGNFNDKLIEGFKKKIVNLDRERLDIMFAALDQVENVLGKGPEAREYYRYLDEMELQRFHER